MSEFNIENLGEAKFKSPLQLSSVWGDNVFNYVSDSDRIILDPKLDQIEDAIKNGTPLPSLAKGGPRKEIFFDPKETTAAIVTCGGLCPGLNNVIRGIVMALHYFYGIKRIIGIPYGYEGLNPEKGHEIIELTPDIVDDIHQSGGSILGSHEVLKILALWWTHCSQ